MKTRKTNLKLNKKLIAKLINPARIIGGEEENAEAGGGGNGGTAVNCSINSVNNNSAGQCPSAGNTYCLCGDLLNDDL